MKYLNIHHGNNFNQDIPIIGFGAMGISEFYGATDKEEAINTIQSALANGINYFDTADVYGFGENEIFLGKVLKLNDKTIRKDLIIASKAGIIRDKTNPAVRGISIEPEYFKGQLEKSLANLGTDYLDIYYIHRILPTASTQELEDLAKFLLAMKDSGVINSIGLSEPNLEQLQIIHQICQVSFVQSEYNLLERVVEKNGILEFCRQNSINFVAYSPLCRGLLTDNFDPSKLETGDFRLSLPKFTGGNYQANLRIINQLKVIAKDKAASLSCLSLAWLIQQEIIVIPGMRKQSRVRDALKALQFELNNDDLARLNDIAYIGSVQGTRYAPAAMQAYGLE